MSSEQQLLQAVAANADDIKPRLIYADWLEERGDPRGEYIRISAQLDSIPAFSPGVPDLLMRRRQLHEEQTQVWSRRVEEYGFNIPSACFDEAFPDHVHSSIQAFCNHAGHLEELLPWVRWVIFDDIEEGDAARLARLPALARLRTISLVGHEANADFLRQLGNSAFVKNLDGMIIVNEQLGDGGAAAIADGNWRKLKRLELCKAGLSATGVATLATSGLRLTELTLDENSISGDNQLSVDAALRSLELLSIKDCSLSDDDVYALTNANWPNLQRLFCGLNLFGSDVFGALLDSTRIPHLNHIDASYGFAGETALNSSSETRPPLESLNLTNSGFNDERLARLPVWYGHSKIREVDLRSNEDLSAALSALTPLKHLEKLCIPRISQQCARWLKTRDFEDLRYWKKLRLLEVEETPPDELLENLIEVMVLRQACLQFPYASIPDDLLLKYLPQYWNPAIGYWNFADRKRAVSVDVLTELVESPMTHYVEEIEFGPSNIDGRHCEILAQAPLLSNLDLLVLDHNRLNPADLQQLLESPHLGLLKKLHVSHCGIDDRAVETIANSSGLCGLRQLHLNNNPISDRGAETLLNSPYLPEGIRVHIDCEGVSEDMRKRFVERARR